MRPLYCTHTHTYIYTLQNGKYLSFISTLSTLRKQRETLYGKAGVCVCASTVLYPWFKAGHDKESQNVQTHRRTEQKVLRSPPKNVFQPRGFGKTLRGQINSAENLRPFPAL